MVDVRQKQQKFNELAEKRVNNAISQIRLIGNLSDKRHYQYTEEQAKKIITALTDELNYIKQRYKTSLNGKRSFKI